MKQELRLSGSGGQGVITAAVILAEAAVAEGLYAAQSQSYGPEARGGAAKAEVILSDQEIDHPHVEHPDLLLAMTQKAADRYAPALDDAALLVLDRDLVPDLPAHENTLRFPITRMAEDLGSALYANMVALGVLTQLLEQIPEEAVRKALLGRVPPATREKNEQAFFSGFHAAENARAAQAALA